MSRLILLPLSVIRTVVSEGESVMRESLILNRNWKYQPALNDAEIFVSGKKAGIHQGGDVGAPGDITGQVKPGKNSVAVRLNNLWKAGLVTRMGNTFSGGIDRNVRLAATHPHPGRQGCNFHPGLELWHRRGESQFHRPERVRSHNDLHRWRAINRRDYLPDSVPALSALRPHLLRRRRSIGNPSHQRGARMNVFTKSQPRATLPGPIIVFDLVVHAAGHACSATTASGMTRRSMERRPTREARAAGNNQTYQQHS